MTNVTLLIIIIIFAVILMGVIVFLWYQFNSTDSRLVNIIKDRIAYEKLSSEQDDIIEKEEE